MAITDELFTSLSGLVIAHRGNSTNVATCRDDICGNIGSTNIHTHSYLQAYTEHTRTTRHARSSPYPVTRRHTFARIHEQALTRAYAYTNNARTHHKQEHSGLAGSLTDDHKLTLHHVIILRPMPRTAIQTVSWHAYCIRA